MTDSEDIANLEDQVFELIRKIVSQSNHGGLATDILIVAAMIPASLDDATAYVYVTPDGQSVHRTLGLVTMADLNFKRRVEASPGE